MCPQNAGKSTHTLIFSCHQSSAPRANWWTRFNDAHIPKCFKQHYSPLFFIATMPPNFRSSKRNSTLNDIQHLQIIQPNVSLIKTIIYLNCIFFFLSTNIQVFPLSSQNQTLARDRWITIISTFYTKTKNKENLTERAITWNQGIVDGRWGMRFRLRCRPSSPHLISHALSTSHLETLDAVSVYV